MARWKAQTLWSWAIIVLVCVPLAAAQTPNPVVPSQRQPYNSSTLATAGTPSAPTAALAGAGAGNVDDGTHVYCVTFVTATGETACSASSSSVNVADKTTNGKVTVTIPVSPFSGVTGRNIYRSAAGTTTPRFRVAASPVVANNTATTYLDNIADASLTVTTAPTSSTVSDAVTYTLTGVTNRFARLEGITAWCSAGSATLTATDGTTTWTSSTGMVGTSMIGVAFLPPRIWTAGATLTVTLGTCGAGNQGSLQVQAEQF